MRISDVQVGDELPVTYPDVSLERVRLFVESTNMAFPRFTDHEKARREGLPGAIVPGIMSQGLLAAMIHTWAPGSEIRKLDTVFRNPIIVGSRATCAGAVTDVDTDQRLVELDITMHDEAGVTTVLGTAVVALEA
jgi:acyl dehydratase